MRRLYVARGFRNKLKYIELFMREDGALSKRCFRYDGSVEAETVALASSPAHAAAALSALALPFRYSSIVEALSVLSSLSRRNLGELAAARKRAVARVNETSSVFAPSSSPASAPAASPLGIRRCSHSEC